MKHVQRHKRGPEVQKGTRGAVEDKRCRKDPESSRVPEVQQNTRDAIEGQRCSKGPEV
jgi:hypothetical protein